MLLGKGDIGKPFIFSVADLLSVSFERVAGRGRRQENRFAIKFHSRLCVFSFRVLFRVVKFQFASRDSLGKIPQHRVFSSAFRKVASFGELAKRIEERCRPP